MLNLVFTEATEVCLILFNDLHVQQAMSMVGQHPELTEVLRLQLHVTEGQKPVDEPQSIDSVVQATIKPVDKREGSIPTPIPSERNYSSHASLTLGLNSQKAYSRLSRYLQSIAKLDLIPVEANGNCLFSSVHRAEDSPLEYQTIHLKHQLAMIMANHHAFLFPILKASIATTYGFPRISEEDYLRKYNDGTLTQNEADDHNTPGPFSYLGYMQALLKEGFWCDELCLALISMMWQISILKDTDLVLVHCQG